MAACARRRQLAARVAPHVIVPWLRPISRRHRRRRIIRKSYVPTLLAADRRRHGVRDRQRWNDVIVVAFLQVQEQGAGRRRRPC